MTAATTLLTQYDRRRKLVQDIVKDNSGLTDDAAADIAVRVLHALDRVPEKLR